MQAEQFLCREDNIGILLHDQTSNQSVAVDAPSGEEILERLHKKQRKLAAVLITHFHADHTAGIPLLLRETSAAIFMPQNAENSKNFHSEKITELQDLQDFTVGRFSFTALSTPGHSTADISYYLPQQHMLFSGDTLFSLGCGRVFTNDMEMMFRSLQKLAALPKQTQLYCGHEYSAANARFALSVEPHNQALQQRAAAVSVLRAKNSLTLPSSVGQELQTNPFLRCNSAAIRKALSYTETTPDTIVFAALRRLKDNF